MATGDTLKTESPMSKTLYRPRQLAYAAQSGLCFYCSCVMWLRSHEELTKPYGITKKQANRLQCTAEHLTPRSEGGSDMASNLVAACLHCNSTRHKRKIPPSPDRYLSQVRSRIARGGWHPPGVVNVLFRGTREDGQDAEILRIHQGKEFGNGACAA